MHGKGTFKSPSGDSYKGEWKDDKIGGKGTYYYQNGNVYSGEWRDGTRYCGVMSYAYANGDVYDGEWENDLKDGKGTMKFSNGDEYKGEFKNDQLHGEGVMTYAAGDLLKSSGEWNNGKKHGNGKFEDTTRREEVYYKNDEAKSSPRSRKRNSKVPSVKRVSKGVPMALMLIIVFDLFLTLNMEKIVASAIDFNLNT